MCYESEKINKQTDSENQHKLHSTPNTQQEITLDGDER